MLPVIHLSGQERELANCPVLDLGIPFVALWRVAALLGCTEREAARRLGQVQKELTG